MKPQLSLLPLIALAFLTACTNPPAEEADNLPPPLIARPGLYDDPEPEPEKAPDFDAYFSESSAITRSTPPPVITRNVLQDRSGGFWLATWQGIVRYDGQTFTNVTNQAGLRRYRAFCLLEDHEGAIWVGTTGAGLYRYDGKKWFNYTTADGLGDNGILSLFQDRDRNIWIGGGGGGITRYDGTTFTAFGAKDGFATSDVHSIAQAPDGRIWIGTRGALFHYDGKRFVNFTAEHGVDIEPNSYTPAIVDRKGHIWFGGSKGLYHYDGERVRHLFEPVAFSIFEDSRGRIWFTGGELEGRPSTPGHSVINRFDPTAGLENILTAHEQIEVEAHAIFGIIEDRDGQLWLGAGRGVRKLERDIEVVVTHPPTEERSRPKLTDEDHARLIRRIEEGLRPEVHFEGDPTWSLEERMQHYGVPGVGIAVIHDGKVAWHRTYGVADRETGAPVETDTLFQAGSVSKPVAALGALELVESGKLTLTGDVNDLLRSWKVPENEFTAQKKVNLTHLLSHTGGLTVHGFPGYAVGAPVPSLVQVLDGSEPANTPPIRVDKEPGGSYRYSGGGYSVAQQLMIDVTKTPFPEWMHAAVLAPLGMTQSTYENPLPASWLERAAAGYLPDKSPVAGKRHTYPEMAAAGLWTTAEDLARFAVEVQRALEWNGKVLSRGMARKMVEPVDSGYGHGFSIDVRDGHVYFGHGGWDEGFCAELKAHRDDGYGVVVMINSNHPAFIGEVVRAVAAEYGWGGYDRYRQEPIPEEALASYPGRYRYNAEQMFTIARRGDRLFMQYAGWRPEELLHVGDGRFMRRERTSPITFTEEDGTPVFHFMLPGGGYQTHRRMAEGEQALRERVLGEPYEQALAAYRVARESSPEEGTWSEGYLTSQGLMLIEHGEVDGAIALLRINTELHPNAAYNWYCVGQAYREKGDREQAVHYYKKALEVVPDFRGAKQALAELGER